MRKLVGLLSLVLVSSAAADTSTLEAVNALRTEAGRGPIAWSDSLETIAGAHAADMARRGEMSHRGADGSGPADRARDAGYRFCRIAENVARGHRSEAAVIAAWDGSRAHRRNMLDRNVTRMAIARAPGNYWVMLLARPGC
jgi:uncharacterized protein YkwD